MRAEWGWRDVPPQHSPGLHQHRVSKHICLHTQDRQHGQKESLEGLASLPACCCMLVMGAELVWLLPRAHAPSSAFNGSSCLNSSAAAGLRRQAQPLPLASSMFRVRPTTTRTTPQPHLALVDAALPSAAAQLHATPPRCTMDAWNCRALPCAARPVAWRRASTASSLGSRMINSPLISSPRCAAASALAGVTLLCDVDAAGVK